MLFIIKSFLLLIIAVPLLANPKIQVQDKETGSKLVSFSCKFQVLNSITRDSIKIVKSDFEGNINIPFHSNTVIQINALGYNKYLDTINFSNPKSTDSVFKIQLIPLTYITKEIVTTGQYSTKTSQESIFPVKVIDEARIQSQSATTLKDVMNYELNSSVLQDNVLGSGMSIRGISGQNVKIMIDGVPVVGRLNGNIDISQINIANVKRIEVIEGPMSAIYGTDALGGVINIITNDATSGKIETKLNSYYESVGVYNTNGNLNYKAGDNQLILTLGRNFFSGYSEHDTSRSQLWKPKLQEFGDFNYIYQTKDLTFRYSGKAFYEEIRDKGDLRAPFYENAFDNYYISKRLTNSLFLQSILTEKRFLDFNLSYTYFDRTSSLYFNDLVNLKKTLQGQNFDLFKSLLFRGTYSSDGVLREVSYQLGYDINLDEVGGTTLIANKKVQDYAAFASLQYKLFDQYMIQPALRVISNSLYSAPIIPSVNFRTNLDDNLILRASYARGFRAPSLQELYFYFVDVNHNIQGNQQLKAEISNCYNLSTEYSLQNELSICKLEAKLYYNDIFNQINLALLDPTQYLYSYINIGRYKTQGAEFSVSYFNNDWTIKAGINYTGRYFEITDTTKSNFQYTPEFQSVINYNISSIDTKINLLFKYSGKINSFVLKGENQIQTTSIDSYKMCDVSLSKNILDNKFLINLGLKNLFDIKNVFATGGGNNPHTTSSNSQLVAWGRTLFISLGYNFK